MSVRSLCLTRAPRIACVTALIAVALSPSFASGDSPTSPFPGLELIPSKNVGALYRRPDVDITAYKQVIIGEPTVEFSKNWNPRNYGTFGLSAQQLTKIRTDLAALAKSAFAKSLADGGYAIVTETGDNVLVITPNIVNVFISAPDVQTAGRSRTYAMDAGSATLALQVNDAVTGTLLAVAYDQRKSQSARMQWTTSLSNRATASAMLDSWAEQVKRELEAARAK
jgi:hypothetical protein